MDTGSQKSKQNKSEYTHGTGGIMNSIFKYAVIFKDERIEIAGFGNYSIETLVSVILEGNAGTSYPYLTDCLREKLEELRVK
jgi:hypothetical protein